MALAACCVLLLHGGPTAGGPTAGAGGSDVYSVARTDEDGNAESMSYCRTELEDVDEYSDSDDFRNCYDTSSDRSGSDDSSSGSSGSDESGSKGSSRNSKKDSDRTHIKYGSFDNSQLHRY